MLAEFEAERSGTHPLVKGQPCYDCTYREIRHVEKRNIV